MFGRLLFMAVFCILLAAPAWSQDFNIDTVAGDGGIYYNALTDEGAQATEVSLYRPHGVDVDSAGNLYIADYSHNSIRKVDPVGVITTLADSANDGLRGPTDVAVYEDGSGNLTIYIAEISARRISKVDGAGNFSVVTAANQPRGVDVDEFGNVFFAEYYSHTVRKIDPSGNVAVVAGTDRLYGYSGDGGPATEALLWRPYGVTVVGSELFIADTHNNCVRKVDADGIITTVVGNGSLGYSGDGGLATEAQLNKPYGVTVDDAGNLYVVDTNNHRVRKVDGTGIITAFAGSGSTGYDSTHDGGLATEASLYGPARIVFAGEDVFYVADYNNQRVRKLYPRPPNSQPTTSGLGDVTVIEDAADTLINLATFFDDVEDGAANLDYSVQSNSNPALVTVSLSGTSLTLSYTPEESGTSEITVRGTDSEGLFVESPFTVTVNAVNDIPTTSGLADVTVDEDAPDTVIELTGFFSDVEDGAAGLIYSVEGNSNPSLVTVSLSDSTLTLAYAANASGIADVTVRGTDSGNLPAENTFRVTVNAVNDQPTTTGLGDVTVDEDALDTVIDLAVFFDDVEDGPGGLTYSVANNSNASLVSATANGGELTLDYAADAFGGADVTVRATDSGELVKEDTFSVTVNPVNDRPTTSGLGDVTVDEDAPDTLIDLTASFADVEDGASGLVFTVETNSNSALVTTTISGTWLTLAYATEAAGSADLTVRATDGADPGLFVESPFTVTVNVINDAPQFDSAAVTTAKDGEAYLYNIVTNDAEGNALTITAPTKPAWLSLVDNGDGSAVFSGNPGPGDVGANPVVLQVTDDGAPAASSSQAFTVTVSAADNNAPTSAGIADVTVDEDAPDTLIDLTSSFDDLEDGAAALIYSVTGNSNGSLVTAAVSGSTVTLDYAADAFGVATITVRGTDSGGLFIEESVAVTVNGVNDPPSAVGVGDIIVDEDAADTLIDLTTAFADLEDGPGGLVYRVSANSNAALVNSVVSGSDLTLSYASNASGVAVITVRGTDSGDLYVEDTFTVTVNAVNDAPQFESVPVSEAYEGQGYVYLVVTSDPEGFGLVVSAPTKPAWLTLSDNGDGTAILSGVPGAGDLGDHAVELQVVDAELPKGTASQSFTISVTPPVNTPPTTMGLADLTVDEDAADTSVDLTSVFEDLEDGAAGLTYGVTNNTNESLVTTAVAGGTLTLSYAAESSGSTEITVRGTDSEGLFVEDVFVVTVTAVNDAPTTLGIGDVTVDENSADTMIDLLAFFDDAEEGAAALRFLIEGNSNASLVSPTISGGDLTLSYTAETYGVAEVTVRASDSAGQFVSDTFIVTVNKVNNVPVITEGAGSPVNMDEDGSPTPFSLTLNATDADGDLLLWSISGAATHGTASAVGVGASKAISYAPEADYVGSDSFTVQVTDGFGGFATHTVTVNLAAQNDAPTITGQNALITPENTPLTIALSDLTVSDPDSPSADFVLTVLDGAGYSRAGNEITPAAGFVGMLPVAVKVEDGEAESAAFDLSVSVTPTYGLPEVTPQVQAGASFSGQVKSDGTLWSWGSNGSSQLGYDTLTDLDPSSSNSSTIPQPVGTDSDWAQIALGYYHAAALKTDGSLWGWGRNIEGQLGDGTNDPKAVPAPIGGETDWVALAAGDKHTVALKSDGTLWAWGYNNDGQLGNGDRINQNAPVQVDAAGFDPANPWTQVATGSSFTLGIKLDGSLWGWGDNFFGQLGSAVVDDYSTTPVRLGATDKVWASVAAGRYHSLAVDSAGNLWAWGSNDYGQLGDGTVAARQVPLQVTSGVVWSTVEAGNYFSAGVQSDGTLWTWGANDFGQLGDGNGGLGFFKNAPAQVGGDTDWVDVAAGGSHTLALKADGSVHAWGSNQNGQLGDASFNDTVAGSVSIDTVTTLTNNAAQTVSGSVDGSATSVTMTLEYIDDLGNPVNEAVTVSHSPGLLTWSADLTLSAEGENVITVTATDGGLYTATAQEHIVYDKTAPEAPLFDDMVGVTLTDDSTPTWLWNSGGGDGSGAYQYKLNDGVWSAETFATSYTPASDLGQGINTLYVQERDAAGNWSTPPGEYALEVDTIAPSAPSVSSSEPATRNLQPTWTWTSGDGSGTFKYNFDGAGWSLSTTETTYTPPAPLPVAEGEAVTYRLEVQERDAAGNWSNSGFFDVTVDRAPPWLADIDDVPTNDSTVQLSGMADSDVTLDVALDTGATATELTFTFGTWLYEITGLTSGANLVTVTATDDAGNATVKTGTITLNTAPTTSDVGDVTVDEDAPATTIDLTSSFADAEDGAAGLTYSVADNSNAALVSTVVAGGSLTLTYADDASGSADVTVRATDSGGMTVDSTFTVTVNAVNDPPTATGLAAVTVDEDAADTTIDLTAAFGDVEDGAAALTYTVADNNNAPLVSATVAGGTLTLSYVESANGSAVIIVRATDVGGLFIESPLSVTVNAVNYAPTLSGTPAVVAVQGVAYSFAPIASDADPEDTLAFSISTQPAWAGFDPASGVLSGTPGNEHVGVTTEGIVITVTDGKSSVSLPAFDLAVNNTNDPPTIGGAPTTSVAQDSPYSFIPVAEDVDTGDVLTFSISGAPAWADFDTASGELSGTPGNDDVGITSGIVITVTDSAAESASLPHFDLEVTDVNDPPTISGTPVTSVAPDTPYSFIPVAEDVDAADTLAFSVSGAPAWAAFDAATGELSGTPSAADVGTTSGVVISVTDGELSASLPAFDLAVELGNNAPTISGNPGTTAIADRFYSFVPTANDPDAGDSLTFSIDPMPTWASFDENSGALTGTPSTADIGVTDGIVITVTDSEGESASLPFFNLAVVEGNHLPTISGSPATVAVTDQQYRFIPAASDADGDALTFSINVSLSWASFDTGTGELSGTPSSADIGTVAGIVITVTDSVGESALLPAFDLVVRENVAPEVSSPPADRMAWEGSALSLLIPADTFSDGDPGDVLTLSVDGPEWLNLEIDAATGDGTLWAPASDTVFGTYTVAITATDTAGAVSAPATFTLRVARISPVEGAALEWGSIEIAPGETLTIPLARDYVSPVVVARNEASEDGFGFVQVVAAPGASSFEARYVADSGGRTTLFYLVAEQGGQNLGSLTVQAGTVSSGASVPLWQAVDFPRPFAAPPAVFASVQTDAASGPCFARVQNVSRTGLEIAMQDAAGGVQGTETLGWIAIEEGIGRTADNRTVLVLKTTASDTARWYDFRDEYGSYFFAASSVSQKFSSRYQDLTQFLGEQAYAESFSAPYMHMLGSLASANDVDAAILRYEELGQTRVKISVQEGTPGGTHTTEDVSIFVAQ